MWAQAERHVLVVLVANVEFVGLIKLVRIAVGRGEHLLDEVTFSDRLTAKIDVCGRDTVSALCGGVVAQHFFYGATN